MEGITSFWIIGLFFVRMGQQFLIVGGSSVPNCDSLLVSSTGLQPKLEGTYIYIQHMNGRPSYKHTVCPYYLYYVDQSPLTYWLFGPINGGPKGHIMHITKADSPELANTTWLAYNEDTSQWQEDSNIEVTCNATSNALALPIAFWNLNAATQGSDSGPKSVQLITSDVTFQPIGALFESSRRSSLYTDMTPQRLLESTNDLSIVFWVQPGQFYFGGVLQWVGTSLIGISELGTSVALINSKVSLFVGALTDLADVTNTSASVIPNIWNHVTITYRKSTSFLVVYINGTAEWSGSLAGLVQGTAMTSFFIGAVFTSTDGSPFSLKVMDGILACVGIYDVVLSEQNIMQIMDLCNITADDTLEVTTVQVSTEQVSTEQVTTTMLATTELLSTSTAVDVLIPLPGAFWVLDKINTNQDISGNVQDLTVFNLNYDDTGALFTGDPGIVCYRVMDEDNSLYLYPNATIVFWIYPEQPGGVFQYVNANEQSIKGLSVYSFNTGLGVFTNAISSTSEIPYIATDVLAPNGWNHVALVYTSDDNKVDLYVNGTAVWNWTIPDFSEKTQFLFMFIGVVVINEPNTVSLTGKLACIGFYNASFTEEQVLKQMEYCNISTPEVVQIVEVQECISKPCDADPCENGGKCISNDPACGLFKCVCDSSYSGYTCDTCVETPCMINPCANGGYCEPNVPTCGLYTCECMPEYSGDNCDTCVATPCVVNPCANGGFCEPNVPSCGLYTCDCQSGYAGSRCDNCLATPCDGVTCYNEGKCQPNVPSCGEYTCQCLEKYSGDNCECPKGFTLDKTINVCTNDVNTESLTQQDADVMCQNLVPGGKLVSIQNQGKNNLIAKLIEGMSTSTMYSTYNIDAQNMEAVVTEFNPQKVQALLIEVTLAQDCGPSLRFTGNQATTVVIEIANNILQPQLRMAVMEISNVATRLLDLAPILTSSIKVDGQPYYFWVSWLNGLFKFGFGNAVGRNTILKLQDKWYKNTDAYLNKLVLYSKKPGPVKFRISKDVCLNGYWTSGKFLNPPSRFVWSATGQFLTYQNWMPNEPDTSQGSSCLAVKTGSSWFLDECQSFKCLICEISPGELPVATTTVTTTKVTETNPTCFETPCSSTLCYNGGTCLPNTPTCGQYTCKCLEKYVGENCGCHVGFKYDKSNSVCIKEVNTMSVTQEDASKVCQNFVPGGKLISFQYKGKYDMVANLIKRMLVSNTFTTYNIGGQNTAEVVSEYQQKVNALLIEVTLIEDSGPSLKFTGNKGTTVVIELATGILNPKERNAYLVIYNGGSKLIDMATLPVSAISADGQPYMFWLSWLNGHFKVGSGNAVGRNTLLQLQDEWHMDTDDYFNKLVVYSKQLGSVKFRISSDVCVNGFWTSGQFNPPSSYVWSATGQFLTYQTWMPGEPNVSLQSSCVAVKVGTSWFLEKCQKFKCLICEAVPGDIPDTTTAVTTADHTTTAVTTAEQTTMVAPVKVEKPDCDACANSPCINGNCINSSCGKYTCDCYEHYTGVNCECDTRIFSYVAGSCVSVISSLTEIIEEASRLCNQRDAHLVSIENEEEMNAIQQLINPGNARIFITKQSDDFTAGYAVHTYPLQELKRLYIQIALSVYNHPRVILEGDDVIVIIDLVLKLHSRLYTQIMLMNKVTSDAYVGKSDALPARAFDFDNRFYTFWIKWADGNFNVGYDDMNFLNVILNTQESINLDKLTFKTMMTGSTSFKISSDLCMDGYWTSGRYIPFESEPKFHWLTTNEKLNYTNWASDEPDTSYTKNCIYMISDGTWAMKHCHMPKCFICEVMPNAVDRKIRVHLKEKKEPGYRD